MKILLLMLLMFFTLAACGQESNNTPYETYRETYNEASNGTIGYTYQPLIPRWTEGDELLPEHLLCDFNYLMHTLRLNFPLFGPAHRGHGIDIDQIEARTRQAILDRNTYHPVIFSRTLQRYFFNQFHSFGHLFQVPQGRLHLWLANIYRDGINEYGGFTSESVRLGYELMTAPAAVRFYGEIIVDLGNYESGMINPGNVTTDILIEGEVAYINVMQFNHYNIDHDKEIVFAFFEEIANFNHLIIDLRLNRGGFCSYFYYIFVEPNILAPLEWQVSEFLSSGQQSRIFSDAFIADIQQANPREILISNAAAFIAENNMRYFNHDDLGMLQDTAIWQNRRYPASDAKAFNGKIWLLIGPHSASAVESVAIFAKETGFATLVGQPTAGIMGAMSAFVLLPNSGILVRYDIGYITDSYGRSFEEFGVPPHFFNRPMMDALQTTLALIEEGAY